MSILAIAGVSIRRLTRDRTALFFLLVLPVLVILLVGATVNGFDRFRVGVVDLGAGPAGTQLVAHLRGQRDLEVHRYDSIHAMAVAVARSEVSAGVVLPAGMDSAERSGRPVTVGLMAERANTTQQAAATALAAAVAQQGALVQAAQFATTNAGGTFDRNLAVSARLAPGVPRVGVQTSVADANLNVLPSGFSYSAPTMLVLFVFLNALAGGAIIIENRRLGMYQRMATAPIRGRTIVFGETLTYVAIALAQSAIIVGVGSVVFGVSWGDPVAAVVLVALWAVVGAGAGMLAGTLLRTPQQATAIGPALGIALGMLGGCMWPLAVVSSAMRQLGHVTPQAWAVDAWTSIISRGGTLASITHQLAVLVAFAAVFLVVAQFRLRRILASS